MNQKSDNATQRPGSRPQVRDAESVRLRAGAAEVWDFVADPANLHLWTGGLRRYRPAGEKGRGLLGDDARGERFGFIRQGRQGVRGGGFLFRARREVRLFAGAGGGCSGRRSGVRRLHLYIYAVRAGQRDGVACLTGWWQNVGKELEILARRFGAVRGTGGTDVTQMADILAKPGESVVAQFIDAGSGLPRPDGCSRCAAPPTGRRWRPPPTPAPPTPSAPSPRPSAPSPAGRPQRSRSAARPLHAAAAIMPGRKRWRG